LSTPATQTYDAVSGSVKFELILNQVVTSNSGNSFSTFFRPSSEAKIERSLIFVTEEGEVSEIVSFGVLNLD